MSTSISSYNQSSALHDSTQKAFMWTTRFALGDAINSALKKDVATSAKSTSYAQILGLEGQYLADGKKNPKFVSGRDNLNRLKPSTVWQHMTGDNINGGKFTAARYAKETLWNNNVSGITDFKNAPGTVISKGLGLGLLGFQVGSQTKDGYHAAKAKHGDNDLAVAASTAGAFGVSAAKAGVAWEVSNVLYDIGRTTLPKMTLGKVPLGGILLGAVGAVATAHTLDAVIPPPQKPSDANKSSAAPYTAVHQAINSGNGFGGSQSVYA